MNFDRNEECEKALELINEILEREGYSRITKANANAKEEVVVEAEEEAVVDLDNNNTEDANKKSLKVTIFIVDFGGLKFYDDYVWFS